MNQKGLSLTLILIVVFLLVLIGGGVYYLMQKNSVIPSSQQSIAQNVANTPQPTPSITQAPTDSWQIFTNTKYGYSINYPNAWNLGGSGPGQTPEFIAQHFWVTLEGSKNCWETTKYCGHITIKVEELSEKDSTLSAKEVWLRNLTKDMSPVINKEENLELSGTSAIKISYVNNFIGGQTSESTAPIPMKTVVLVHNKKIYTIDVREQFYSQGKPISPKDIPLSEWQNTSLYDQIISTFKFSN
ncbi:hypothetical protein HY383_02235 [Candidatus Daviesbacteria bacterium]|nr:hypothetical protein [Candidatus Daviesbacteria bacterium]